MRGVYHTLGDKSVSNTPVVSSTDFHIALYEHCVPEEKKIVITEAILAWCPEWRAHFDEQMRQNEAACDNLDDVDDDGKILKILNFSDYMFLLTLFQLIQFSDIDR